MNLDDEEYTHRLVHESWQMMIEFEDRIKKHLFSTDSQISCLLTIVTQMCVGVILSFPEERRETLKKGMFELISQSTKRNEDFNKRKKDDQT